MTHKLIYFGTLERLKIYVGILIFYLLFFLVSSLGGPILEVNIFSDTYIDVSSALVLGMSLTALMLMELILFVRDFYSSTAYLLFSLPVKGSAVVGSRVALFLQNIVLLTILDLPTRVPMVRAILSGLPDEIGHEVTLPAASEMLWPGIVSIVAGLLVLTLIPLITYFLISSGKCIFDLNSSWLVPYITGVLGVIFLIGYLISDFVPHIGDFIPQLIDIHYYNAKTYAITVNYFLLLPLMLINGLFFWAGSWIIDRKLNI
jgi:hypothetical protein